MGDMEDPITSWPTGRLLSMAARLVEHSWAEALERLGLTHAGLVALHLLGERALSQTELAAKARVQVQTMSRTLERLEREGNVTRKKDETDARRHVVSRTAKGEAAWQAAQTLEADHFPGLSHSNQLRTALLEIIADTSNARWP